MFEKLVLRELVELVAMLLVHVEMMQLTWRYLIKWLKVFLAHPAGSNVRSPRRNWKIFLGKILTKGHAQNVLEKSLVLKHNDSIHTVWKLFFFFNLVKQYKRSGNRRGKTDTDKDNHAGEEVKSSRRLVYAMGKNMKRSNTQYRLKTIQFLHKSSGVMCMRGNAL